MVWDEYTWVFACGICVALFMAWGIGANDVANAFGTSVGAKALTLRQAIVIASVCEFTGAVLLGAAVTDTIKGGIAKASTYTYAPELLMYGMLCALTASGLWLALATFLELPVSTTHTIIGSIIGFSLVAGGGGSIIWTSPPSGGSPFPGGFVAIVMAWFITPAMAMVVAASLFQFTKFFVLYAKEPFKRALWLFPIYTFITIWVMTYFVIQKGVNGWMKTKTYGGSCPAGGSSSNGPDASGNVTGCAIPDATNAWISAVTAATVTVICAACLKWVVRLVERDYAAMTAEEERVAALIAAKEAGIDPEDMEAGVKDSPTTSEGPESPTASAVRTPNILRDMRKSRVWNALSHGAQVNIHDTVVNDPKIREMHSHAEVFDRKSELTFKYLQVCTASVNSFAHGANDVANSIGPLAAIYGIWECSCASSKSSVPIWMFVIGGVGLIIGLATYGYNIMRALGVKVTKLTNARGYCAELTAAIIVIVASRYGFPVSTTQVITGAIAGIGLLETITAKIKKQPNATSRFNWLIILKFFAGWVATLFIAALTSAAFMAQGIYSPNKDMVNQRADWNAALNSTNYGMATTLNATGVPELELEASTLFNATKALTINTTAAMVTFEAGSWALGNATLQGYLNNTFMPNMPLYVL